MTIHGLQGYMQHLDAHGGKLQEMSTRVDVTPAELTQALLETTVLLAQLALHIYDRDERTVMSLHGYV